MIYTIEYLAKALKKTRHEKKLSQRALSGKVGMPQAQISRIENGAVDLKTSSLIGLARALDLEVMLIPRKNVPVVTHLVNTPALMQGDAQSPRPAYALGDEGDDG